MASPVNDSYSCVSGGIIYGGVNGPAATSITLTDYADQRVIQRLGSSRNVAVLGTYAGNPIVIQARVIDSVTSSVVVNWTTIQTNPTGGNFSGTLTVPQGGWYYLQVRDGTNTSIVSNGTNKWGVGLCGVLFGQSNMANFFSGGNLVQPNYPTGDKKAVEWNDIARVRIGNIQDNVAPNSLAPSGYSSYTTVGHNVDGYVYLANRLTEELGIPICLIPYAVGGTSITRWIPSGGDLYANLISKLDAIGGDCELAIFYQGEQDAHTMPTSTWITYVGQTKAGLMSHTGRNTSNFKFGLVSLGPGYYNGSVEGDFGAYRAAQVAWATSTAGAFLVSANHDAQTSDTVHITGEMFARIGRRYSGSCVASITGATAKAGPKVSSASRVNNVVTATITHSGGTAISDGAGGSGNSLTGFRIFDNGVQTTITNTQISGNSIIFTLSSTPTGPVTMDYAIMNNPHNTGNTPSGSLVLSSVVYDNATYYNSAQGFPLQPFAAITVT